MGWMREPSALSFAVASVLWLVAAFGPGYLLACVVDPWRSTLDRWAVAPALSFGVAFPLAAWSGAVGAPGSIWWAPSGLLVVSVVSALLLARRPRAARAARTRARRTTRVAVLAAVGLSVLAWVVALSLSTPGWGAVVPGSDGANHGMFVTDLLRSGSMFDPLVGRLDLASPGTPAATGPFGLLTLSYPFAVHLLAAPIAAVTCVPSALLVPLTLLPSCCLVLGTVALTRRTAGPKAALVAAFAAALLVPGFPFAYAFWGPVALMTAVALVPAVVVVLLDVDLGPGRRALALPVLSVAGLLGVHVSEGFVAVGIAGLAVLLGRGPVLRALGRLVGALALALVVVGPLTFGLLGGAAVRPLASPPGVSPGLAAYVSVVRPFVADTAVPATVLMLVQLAGIALVAVTVVGSVVAWRRPPGRSVVLVVACSVVLVAISYVVSLGPLLAPWYGSGTRLGAQVAALLPGLLGTGALAVARRARARGPLVLTTALAGATAVAVLMAAQSVGAAAQGVSDYAVVTPADRTAFSWLATHARPGERVLNDDVDGSSWLYESTRAAAVPLFGTQPDGGVVGRPEYVGRLHLRATIQDIATDPRTRQEARDWRVRYVLVGDRVQADGRRALDLAAIAASHGLRLVFESGDARVYEIVAS